MVLQNNNNKIISNSSKIFVISFLSKTSYSIGRIKKNLTRTLKQAFEPNHWFRQLKLNSFAWVFIASRTATTGELLIYIHNAYHPFCSEIVVFLFDFRVKLKSYKKKKITFFIKFIHFTILNALVTFTAKNKNIFFFKMLRLKLNSKKLCLYFKYGISGQISFEI